MINKLKELRAGGEEEGFTLIELMIVVVIIGILAAIAIPIFANQQKNAIQAGVKSDVKNTVTNVATFLVKNPTADATALAGVNVVTTKDNIVAVSGKWDDYSVTGAAKGDTWAYRFVSADTGSGASLQKGGTYKEGTLTAAATDVASLASFS